MSGVLVCSGGRGLQGARLASASSTGPSWLLVHMVFVEAGVGLGVGTEGPGS